VIKIANLESEIHPSIGLKNGVGTANFPDKKGNKEQWIISYLQTFCERERFDSDFFFKTTDENDDEIVRPA